jgi:hypothetical protein
VVGGPPRATLDGGKAIANFWPYETTIFDFIRRAMPYQQPGSLTNQEVYALTAYILALNKLIGENDTINAEALPKVQMPNRDDFITRFPDRIGSSGIKPSNCKFARPLRLTNRGRRGMTASGPDCVITPLML